MMNSAPAVTSKYVLIHMCWFLFVCISNTLSHCDIGGQNHVGIVAQLYPSLCYTLDYRSPSSSVHEISQQEYWTGLPFSFFRGSSQPRDWTYASCVSCGAGRFFTCWAIREEYQTLKNWKMKKGQVVTFYCTFSLVQRKLLYEAQILKFEVSILHPLQLNV